MNTSPPASAGSQGHAPVTERKYLWPLILITSLFFLWALGVNLNDILIPHFKKTFRLTDFQSAFIQVAFFGGYCLAALPAGWLMNRIGYKKGILTGLLLCATGAISFIPAASASVYAYFLVALFVMACGQSFLEVASNPYVMVLGPEASAARRLNWAQSFNAVGSVVTPFIGAAFILTQTEYTDQQVASMTPAQLHAFRLAEAHTVKIPYLVIAAIFLFVALMIYLTHLPEVRDSEKGADPSSPRPTIRGALAHPHLIKGVFAQFVYVGAQVGVASFVIRFAQHVEPGMSSKVAADYLKFHLIGFAIGRFTGSYFMKYIRPSRLLSLFALGALTCAVVALVASGTIPIWSVVLIGFFHSIMFPTIFALGVEGLGPYTKLGSSFLVMAIIGGAFFPPIMGLISDATDIRHAFIVPLLCYLYIFYFGLQPSEKEPVRVMEAAIAPEPS